MNRQKPEKKQQERRVDRERRTFLKAGITGLAGLAILPSVSSGQSSEPPEKSEAEKAGAERKIVTRTLGKTGLVLPVVSMGVMNSDNPSLVKAALDAGITHLDTAHAYMRGRNEEMIGSVIKDRSRDSYVIATKVLGGHAEIRTGRFTEATKREPFLESFQLSLERLGLDYVDILYLHDITSKESALFEPLLTAMSGLKKEGKARFLGVSTHRNEPEVIRAAAQSKVYDVVLTAYNFRQPHREEMKAAIALAAESGMGVVAMKTQAGVYWDRERQHPINMKAALKWVLADENVHTTIPGFTTFDQLELAMSVMQDLRLTPEEKDDLNVGEKLGLNGLYCPQCQRCLAQCRQGLEIPVMMRAYMYAYGHRNLAAAKETVRDVGVADAPCAACPACTVNCHMGFDVREKVLDVARVTNIPDDFLV